MESEHGPRHTHLFQTYDWLGVKFREPVCLSCLDPHRPSCPQMAYLETQATWYQWELDASPWAFELKNGVDGGPLSRVLTADMIGFTDRFGVIPSCNCGRYRDLYPDDSARRFQKGLLCGLCGSNGQVRTWSAREIRVTLAPRLFAAGQEIHDLHGVHLALDAHATCVVALGRRVTAPLFVETLRTAANA